MAGDWIKMRGALLDHPKVIAMSRALQQERGFRDWLCPGGGGPSNGQLVSHAASRAVTTALLLRAWSSAREHGKFDGDDLWLEHNCIDDLDEMAGAPHVGAAMQAVGWVRDAGDGRGVILPNFKEFNVPMSEAERAKGYRDRKKDSVTIPSRTARDENHENVTPRVEKRRDTPIAPTPRFEDFWSAYPGPRKVAKAKCLAVWRLHDFDSVADQISLHVAAMKATPQWQEANGQYVPAPLTYLNQRRFEDGAPEQPRRRLAI